MLLAKTLFVTLGMTIAAFAADPFIGTWKVNVEKSRTSSGKPATLPRRQLRPPQTDIGSNLSGLPEPCSCVLTAKSTLPQIKASRRVWGPTSPVQNGLTPTPLRLLSNGTERSLAAIIEKFPPMERC